jgi:poly(A) polymerase
LQFQFSKRTGHKAIQLLEHPRFRAAYDLLALRALAGDASIELTDWWTTFQDASEEERSALLVSTTPSAPKKRRKRRKKSNNASTDV